MHYKDPQDKIFYPPDPEWTPVHWSPMLSDRTLGDKIADFAEQYLSPPRIRVSRGQIAKEFRISPYQRWLLRHMFELNSFGFFRYKEFYLQIPRKNGKSFLTACILSYFACRGEEGDEMYCAAKDSKQARVVFDEVKRNVNRSKILRQVLEAKQDVVKNNYKNIKIGVLSANAESTFGLAPYISIADELMAWDSEFGYSKRGEKMVASLTTGSGDRDESMFIGITTAGPNLEGIAYARYDKAKMISSGAISDNSFGFAIWEAEDHDPIDSEVTWRKANPSIQAGFMPIENFRSDYLSAISISTVEFERYVLNKWMRMGDKEQYIQPLYWRQIEDTDLEPIAHGRKITVGFDGSLTEDSTGFVAIDVENGQMEILYKWENDRTDPNWFVDVGEVDSAMTKIMGDYDVQLVYADPSRHQEVVKNWIKTFGRSKVRNIPPNAKRMQPMGDEFRSDVYLRQLKHDGNKRFSEHINNAVLNINGLPRKEKPNSPYKIDFLVCAILANGARRELIDKEKQAARREAMFENF